SRSGMFITVPNSAVLSETVVNHSKSRTRLVEMTVEIDIDDDVKKAIALIDDMLDNLPWRYKNKSEVFIDDVNKDYVILRIKVWIASRKYGERKAELFYKIRDLLKQNNINTSILGD
ncbi:mechanosensitive ion channel, partial [archaeon]|nr:mechanosensitive ion channel [archaeon]